MTLVHAGREFFTLLKQLIRQARYSIHIQTYIFDDDQTGTDIAEALMEAAAKGVKVYLLADGYASQGLSKDFIKKMRDAGIRFRFFEPMFRSRQFYFGRRLHHKVVVIDAVQALVGSMNIADRYNDVGKERAWFDLALHVEGEVCAKLYQLCVRIWTKRRKVVPLPDDVEEFIAALPKSDCCPIRVRQNDWVNNKLEITTTYYNLFRHAKESIVVVSSYFLPSMRLRNQLKFAVRRGVDVRLVLAGTSDVKIAKWAERYLYRWLFRHKITFYEYQPAVLHAKLAMVDRQHLTLGSYNVNGISAYASVELNLDIDDKKCTAEVQEEIEAIIEKDCVEVDPATYKVRLLSLKQLVHWASFYTIRLMLNLSTFYFRQRE